jgi:DNA-binding transcriptional regulator PaaX
VFNTKTLKILKQVSQNPGIPAQALFDSYSRGISYKDFYNTLYRMQQQGLIHRRQQGSRLMLEITADGERLLARFHPERDGIWKLVIFDIPEKQKYVRVVLRAKLKSLHFKKWQNSIWISPYKLDEEIEAELGELAKKFFVRLIKTREINRTEDLEKMFT